MTTNMLLEVFLLVDVFLIGAVVAFTIQHLLTRAQHTKQPPVAQPGTFTSQAVQLPRELRERLIEASKANFKLALEHSAVELQHELKSTTLQLNEQLEKLGREVFAHEMERYRLELEQLRKRADIVIGNAQSEIGEHQAQLRARLAEDMVAEKRQFIEQLDTKLADVVVTFLTETLGNEVDLGAQMPYLLEMLDQHKAEIVGELTEE